MDYKRDRFRPTLTRDDFDKLLKALKTMPCDEYAELYLKLRNHIIYADKKRWRSSCNDIK